MYGEWQGVVAWTGLLAKVPTGRQGFFREITHPVRRDGGRGMPGWLALNMGEC